MANQINLKDILPRETDRAFFVGMTGSGKSTLAKIILGYYSVVYVIDGKEFDAKELATWHKQGFIQVKTLKDFISKANSKTLSGAHKYPKIIYTPKGFELRNPAIIEKWFTYCFLKKNCVVYVDEVTSICNQYYIPDAYLDCLTRGRSRNVMTFSATQRPANIPPEIMTEAENCYIFFLNSDNDRKRVQDNINVSKETIKNLEKREFIYSSLYEREHSEVLTLKLK